MKTSGCAREASGGFTLIEVMIGVAIGLFATVLVAKVLAVSEGWRRGSTSGTDAQVSGGLALYEIQRSLKTAGYGIATEGNALGCILSAEKSGVAIAGLPARLGPVLITAGGANAPDAVRVIRSSKPQFSIPITTAAPFYVAGATVLNVVSSLGVDQGDFLLLTSGVDANCQVLEAGAVVAQNAIPISSANGWSTAVFPDLAPTTATIAINLGQLIDQTYSIDANNNLTVDTRNIARAGSVQRVQSNIVDLMALYGKDTNGDDVVDLYDQVLPTSNAQWLAVRSIRVAVLARSAQFEKEDVTLSAPEWNLGSSAVTTGSYACGASSCLRLRTGGATDWKRYRYKVFESVIPLRNVISRADAVIGVITPPAPTP
ncbi:type IV pilus assembly protein PilW [Inhella inkyongensis]|uniref:Type IV pilus assembly protein PilW n=1 Tax=Inhella inkyongensis TaxID=392593 RepID=A0A840S441_9BURK|nr:PilW family protein [Inhella inkyongensis]MBB5203310.1 type IV pilus assembly protein PilW [Inhella inkyongensis]